MNKFLAISIVAIGIAVAVPVALSQSAGGVTDGVRGQSAQRQPGPRSAKMMPSQRVEAQLARIRTALNITAAQQRQWDAYANLRRHQAAAMDKRFQERRAQKLQRPADAGRATLEERRERQRERLLARGQRLDELWVVEKPLYAALTPDQQRIADEVLTGRGERRQGGGKHRGRPGRA